MSLSRNEEMYRGVSGGQTRGLCRLQEASRDRKSVFWDALGVKLGESVGVYLQSGRYDVFEFFDI